MTLYTELSAPHQICPQEQVLTKKQQARLRYKNRPQTTHKTRTQLQNLWHETTSGITNPPGWDASPLLEYPA